MGCALPRTRWSCFRRRDLPSARTRVGRPPPRALPPLSPLSPLSRPFPSLPFPSRPFSTVERLLSRADASPLVTRRRATRDLFSALSNEERAEAIQALRARSDLPASSPELVGGTHRVSFDGERWCLDGEPWDAVVRNGSAAGRSPRTLLARPPIHPFARSACSLNAPTRGSCRTLLPGTLPHPPTGHSQVTKGVELRAPLVAPPAWAVDGALGGTAATLLADDAALREALAVRGSGLVPSAKHLILALVSSAAAAVALRAASLLRRQYSTVSLPTPAMGGGLGSDQLAAYALDWDAYRLLVLISRLAPGALRPAMPPTFTVPEARLLRVVERWVMRGARVAGRGGDDATVRTRVTDEAADDDKAKGGAAAATVGALTTRLEQLLDSPGSLQVADATRLLKRLAGLPMTTELLRSSGAGRMVNRVKKADAAPEALRADAAKLIHKWKGAVAAAKAAGAAEGTHGSASRVSSADALIGADGSPWASHPSWQQMPEAEASLMEHQKAAIAMMHARDRLADVGHFLILDTGMGKTVTSLVYAYRWLREHGAQTAPSTLAGRPRASPARPIGGTRRHTD